jgi:hypothetical protein
MFGHKLEAPGSSSCTQIGICFLRRRRAGWLGLQLRTLVLTLVLVQTRVLCVGIERIMLERVLSVRLL